MNDGLFMPIKPHKKFACHCFHVMGKKRAYCPYCDVYLVHNSLRSRRDHTIGWKHIASFQAYYARFMPQHFQNVASKKLDEEPIRPSVSRAQLMQPPPLALNPSGIVKGIAPPPTAPIRPPTLAPGAPPTIGGPQKPPNAPVLPPKPPVVAAIKPPTIMPPTIRPPNIPAKPPPIAPPTIAKTENNAESK